MNRSLVFVDGDNPETAADGAGAAEVLHGAGGQRIALTAAADISRFLESSFSPLFDGVIPVIGDPVYRYDPGRWGRSIAALQERNSFDAVILPSTWLGRMVAPSAAAELQVGLTAEVTGISRRADGRIEMVRPAYTGQMEVGVVSRGEGPLMMTVGEHVFRDSASRRSSGVPQVGDAVDPGPGEGALLRQEGAGNEEDIRKAEILVGVGGGASRSMEEAEGLAGDLRGMLAASRPVVDRGLAPRRIQIGLSGKTVQPTVYLALGISGSIQHMAGLRRVRHIIAVNKNRHAPICSLADIVVAGDSSTFISMMRDRIGHS